MTASIILPSIYIVRLKYPLLSITIPGFGYWITAKWLFSEYMKCPEAYESHD